MGLISYIFALVTVTLIFKDNHVEGAAPAFAELTGDASVAEDAAAGTAITITNAPVLSNTPTSVEILGTSTATSQQAFAVALSGTTAITFTVLAAGVLDRETTATMTVKIRASNTDGTTDDGTGDLVVTVTVTDANDNAPVVNPMFACVSMQADTAASTELITMRATDADSGSNGLAGGNYAWDSSTPTAASTKLSIHTDTAVVTVATGQTLLAADGPWTLYVKVTDGGTTAMSATSTLSACVGSGCCTGSGTVIIQGATAVIVLGLLSLFL